MHRSKTIPMKFNGRRPTALTLLSLGDDVAIAAVIRRRWMTGRTAVLARKKFVLGWTLGIMAGLGWIAANGLRWRSPRLTDGPTGSRAPRVVR